MIRIAVLFAPDSATDRGLFYEFQGYLAPLVDRELRLWHIDLIRPGEDREKILQEELAADLVICLVSPDFVASEFCRKCEYLAEYRVSDQPLQLIPILVRSCLLDDTYLERKQLLPRNLKAIMAAENRGESWAEVVQELRLLLSEIRTSRAVLQGKKEVLEMILDARRVPLSARGRDSIRSIDNSFAFGKVLSRVMTCKSESELFDDWIF